MKISKKFPQFLKNFGDWPYYLALARKLKGCNSVLDVGCGSWSPLAKVKKNFYSEGFDINRPSIQKIERTKTHDKYKIGDAQKIDEFYGPSSFDAVMALDLIEHLEKKNGLSLLKKMEAIAKEKVIILTPNGFIKQASIKDNPYQVHQSGWTVEEFKKLGYKVYGQRGLKFIRGEYASIKFKPWFFWGCLSTLSQLLVYRFPRFAYQLLAIKELTK